MENILDKIRIELRENSDEKTQTSSQNFFKEKKKKDRTFLIFEYFLIEKIHFLVEFVFVHNQLLNNIQIIH